MANKRERERAAGLRSNLNHGQDTRAKFARVAGTLHRGPPGPPVAVSWFTGKVRPACVARGAARAREGALDELLILARTNAMVVCDLKDSTYSAVASSWAAHRAAGTITRWSRVGTRPAPWSRPWWGVYLVAHGCQRVPDAEVEPRMAPLFDK